MGKIELHNGDCLEIMKRIEANSIDIIVTDPPYGIRLSKGYRGNNDRLVNGDDKYEIMALVDQMLMEFSRILKPNSAAYIFTRFDVFPYWWIKALCYFIPKNCIVWNKGGGFLGDLKGNYGNNYEMIIFIANGKHSLNGKRIGACINIPKQKIEYHETQKPVELVSIFIEKSSSVGMTVLDPFMGSGTTGIACKNMDRNFIGIELIKDTFDIAKNRIENHVVQNNLQF